MVNSPDKRLWTGHCWGCGEPLFDVLEKYPRSHALAGQPRVLGQPTEDAWRLTLVLAASGRLMNVSLCGGCADTLSMSELTRLLQLRYRIECSPWWREAVNKPAASLLNLRDTQLFHWDVPLGELSRQRWREVA